MNLSQYINSDRRLAALLKLLACESSYGLFLLLPCYWAMTHQAISVRTGIMVVMLLTFALLFITWVFTFKPYRK